MGRSGVCCRGDSAALTHPHTYSPSLTLIHPHSLSLARSFIRSFVLSSGELIELAQISHQGLSACQTMYRVLCERLNRSNQKWRNVAKALDVLVYVVVRGSMEFVELVKGDSNLRATLERLEGFQAVIPDASARDVGASVRAKSKELKRLLADDQAWLHECRERGEIQSRKMAGIDAGGIGAEPVSMTRPAPIQSTVRRCPPAPRRRLGRRSRLAMEERCLRSL